MWDQICSKSLSFPNAMPVPHLSCFFVFKLINLNILIVKLRPGGGDHQKYILASSFGISNNWIDI